MKALAINNIAAVFGCTPDQVRRQFERNAEQLAGQAAKATAKGGKVNGYTATQLTDAAKHCKRRSRSKT